MLRAQRTWPALAAADHEASTIVIRRRLYLRAVALGVAVSFSAAARPPDHSGGATERSHEERGAGQGRDATREEHLRVGALVGVGFPRPFAIEPFVKIARTLGVGAEYSFLPRMSVLGADTSFKAIAADVRVFPFRGPFFVGVRAGRQWLDAKTTISVSRLGSFTESMTSATWFVNPRLGFLFTFDSGMTLGIDAGVQLPINAAYDRTGPATSSGLASANGHGIDETLVTVVGALGNNVTPTIDLLRLGVLF